MHDLKNSNPKIIAAAFAAAAVIGAGSWFVLHEPANSQGAAAGNAPVFSGNKKDQAKAPETPATAVKIIVGLGRAHDAAAFAGRVNMDAMTDLAAEAIKAAYPNTANNGDGLLKKQTRSGLSDALAGKTPKEGDEGAFANRVLDLQHVSFSGIGNVQEKDNKAIVELNLSSENLPKGFVLQAVMEKKSGTWQVISLSNGKEFVKAVEQGRKDASLAYVEQEKPFIKKYNETIGALNHRICPNHSRFHRQQLQLSHCPERLTAILVLLPLGSPDDWFFSLPSFSPTTPMEYLPVYPPHYTQEASVLHILKLFPLRPW